MLFAGAENTDKTERYYVTMSQIPLGPGQLTTSAHQAGCGPNKSPNQGVITKL
jgi:hypothetical protein